MNIMRFFCLLVCLAILEFEALGAHCGCKRRSLYRNCGRYASKPQYYECNWDGVHADTYYSCGVDECGY